MKDDEQKTDRNSEVECQISSYYSVYAARPEYKMDLQKQLLLQAARHYAGESRDNVRNLLADAFSRPRLRWAVGILLLVILLLSLFAIQPVRATIERLLDVGYIEGAGFVKESETYVLTGPTSSIKPLQTMVIDQVVASPKNILVWFHTTGRKFFPNTTFEDNSSFLEVNGQELPIRSWGWDTNNQKGTIEFDPLSLAPSMSVTLQIAPDWSIPISLVPMAQVTTSQYKTIYPNVCQSQLGVELCLRAFIFNSSGYHLELSASSENPIFYLDTLDTSDRLTGQGPILMDSSGHSLDRLFPDEPGIVMELPPRITDYPKEASTTLSFERSKSDTVSLELLLGGLTGKTPAEGTIECQLGMEPKIGSSFPCEKSIKIYGGQISFHHGVITQQKDGIHLTLQSDPIQASNGLLLTGLGIESLDYENSHYLGTEFNSSTNQFVVWLGLDSLNAESKFAIRITSADLTIVQPFKLSWTINP